MYTTAKEAVDRARAGEGPILIEAKSMRMRGHAQHDAADYVPKEMRDYWEKRDPIVRHEKFLTERKILDAKTKTEIESKISALLEKDRDFAESSPMPPADFAEAGVYCTGDDCHKIRPNWQRPLAEVTPPKSSVKPVWVVEGFGQGKGYTGGTSAIHFGDTPAADDKVPGTSAPEKAAAKIVAKPVEKPSAASSNGKTSTAKSAGKSAASRSGARKAGR
jgi:hypothetical protein